MQKQTEPGEVQATQLRPVSWLVLEVKAHTRKQTSSFKMDQHRGKGGQSADNATAKTDFFVNGLQR